MKPEKYQIGFSNNGGPTQFQGGVWVYDGSGPWIASSEYLSVDSAQRYFLKANDPSTPLREFVVLEELTSGDWRQDPPPYLYRIKLAPLESDKVEKDGA